MFWQIIIQDDSDLVGKSVASLIVELRGEVPFEYVRVLNFEGAADQDMWAQLEEEGPIDIPRFLDELGKVRQVDWATFCLSIAPTNIPKDGVNLELPIAVDETIVRCVDGSLLYVYTRREALSEMLRKRHRCLSATLVDLGSVEWPE